MRSILKASFVMWLTSFTSFVFAQSSVFEDWIYGITRNGDALYAATVNDSGRVLGQYCWTEGGDCLFVLGLSTSCEKGNKYPVLVNSNVGSSMMQVYCNGRLTNDNYQFVFTDFDEIKSLVLRASRIGFAFPLKGDTFTVVRFSLLGSNEAIAAMRSEFSTRPTRSKTRDQRL